MSRAPTEHSEDQAAGKQARLAHILSMQPVIPVLTILDAECAVPLATALRAGGLKVVEVMLRSPASEASIRRITRALPDMIVGAGTVVEPAQLARVHQLGAQFAVSPGHTDALITESNAIEVPLLPGASTVSEVMKLLAAGFTHQKFFPAESCGGPQFLRALFGPIPSARFCPTGGIDAGRVAAYLACPNVMCVGGSWVTPGDAIERRDWSTVESLARRASARTAPQL